MDIFSDNHLRHIVDDDSAIQRGNPRDSLLLAAQMRVVGGRDSNQIRVRNLSAGGLMAEQVTPLGVGTPVEVEVRNIGWIPGRIAWEADSRFGMSFDVPIDPKMARKPVGKGTLTPHYLKPIRAR